MRFYIIDFLKIFLFISIGLFIKIIKLFKEVYVFPRRKRNNDSIIINIISEHSQELNVPSKNHTLSMKLLKKNPNIFFIFFDTHQLNQIQSIKIKFENFTKFPDIRNFIEKINFNNILFKKKNLRTKLIAIFL